MGGRLWTDEDIGYLRAHIGDGVPAMAKTLNRTELAVVQKAQSIGLLVSLSQASKRTYLNRLKQTSNAHHALYEMRKEQGLCTRCGQRWAETGKTKCKSCRERDQRWYRNNGMREYLCDYKRLKRAELKENGRCCNCGKKLKPEEIGVNMYCSKCRAKAQERKTVKRIRDRIHGIKRKD